MFHSHLRRRFVTVFDERQGRGRANHSSGSGVALNIEGRGWVSR
jgi:hypothetical protein